MRSTDNTARRVGWLYLLTGLPGAFSFLYVTRTLVVTGNASATAHNILASENLFRAGIIGELVSATAFIFLARALYRLLNGVDEALASLMVTLVLASVPISYVAVVPQIAALTVLHAPGFLSVFGREQLEALAMVFVGMHGKTLVAAQIFWGLWLFPFGLLVMRSRFIPRILGVWLIVNSFAYPLSSLTSLVLPAYVRVVNLAVLPAELGELWIIGWLLFSSTKARQPLPAAA